MPDALGVWGVAAGGSSLPRTSKSTTSDGLSVPNARSFDSISDGRGNTPLCEARLDKRPHPATELRSNSFAKRPGGGSRAQASEGGWQAPARLASSGLRGFRQKTAQVEASCTPCSARPPSSAPRSRPRSTSKVARRRLDPSGCRHQDGGTSGSRRWRRC
jgi:hypothetical protein